MSFFKTAFSWMGSGFSVFVYIAIVALFVTGVLKCILPVTRNTSLLNRAVKNIRKGDKARYSWQNEKFLGKGNLYPHWSEYLHNLFFADGEYHNPANVEDYINEETVMDGPGRSRLSEALPGVQVSLGFLGTLLGLSVALSKMNAADAAQITDSMTTLLSSMKYAFLTSIFGVVASVTFTLLTRIVHGRAERALLSFYNALSRYAGVLSVDPMTQIAIYQQEQTGILKGLMSYFDEERLSRILAPVTESVTKTVDMTCEAQQKLMTGVAEAYISKLDAALHGQLSALSSTIEETCRYQRETIDQVSGALESVSDTARAMQEIKSVSYAVLDKYERVLSRLSQAVDSLSEQQGVTREIVDEQSAYMQELAIVGSEITKQAKNLGEATGAMSKNASDALDSAAGALVSSGEKLAGDVEGARKQLQHDIDESLNYFEATMTTIVRRLDKASKAIKEAAEGLPSVRKPQ